MVRAVRSAGYSVQGQLNGGGWIDLARAVGLDVADKGAARQALIERFGYQERPLAADPPLETPDIKRGRTIVGAHYSAETHSCDVPPWESCNCKAATIE